MTTQNHQHCIRRTGLLVLLAAPAAAAQLDWSQRSPATSPPAHMSQAAAFDSARGRMLVFGGRDASGNLVSDTWEWDGDRWTQRSPATSPSARENFGLAYDSARARTVLFGGADAAGYLADTWEWDGTAWMQRFPATSPPGRSGGAVAFDSARGQTVLFGGMDANGFLGDTWLWDGANWTPTSPAVSPSPRADHGLAYDGARGRVVLFGGQAGCVMYSCFWMNETWEWDGTTWVLLAPSASPSARTAFGFAFDSSRGRTVLFGGYFVLGGPVYRIFFYNDTWEWDGTNWASVATATSPSPRSSQAMAFDPSSRFMILFGGTDPMVGSVGDTWNLIPPPRVASVAPSLGAESGGDLVSIFGSGWIDAASTSVTFGGAGAALVDFARDRLRVRTPPGMGVVDVTVSNSAGPTTVPRAYFYVSDAIAARLGNVNTGRGDREDVLVVNGDVGDGNRELTVRVNERLSASMAAPSSRASARYLLYIWRGAADATTLTPLPRRLGTMVFPTPFAGTTPQPFFVFNNIGRRGTLGAPNAPSSPAPSSIFNRAGGSRAPIVVTLQGIIQDDGSRIPEGYSLTNAVILHVVP